MGHVWFVVLIAALILFGGTIVICGSRGFMEIVTLVKYLGGDDDAEPDNEDETPAEAPENQ